MHRYKARGKIATDKNGTLDNVEFLNIAQDDALSWPRVTHRTYPHPVMESMEATVIPYVKKSVQVNNTFLRFFESKLQLPEGELLKLHDQRELNGGEARCIRTPPKQTSAGVGAHTDFGSLVGNALQRLSSAHTEPETWRRLSFTIVWAVFKYCLQTRINGSISKYAHLQWHFMETSSYVWVELAYTWPRSMQYW